MSIDIAGLARQAIETARELVGGDVNIVLTQQVQAGYDSVRGVPIPGTPITATLTALAVPYRGQFDQVKVPEGKLRTYTKALVVADETLGTVVPATDDQVSFDGNIWNVAGVGHTTGVYRVVVTR